MRELVVNLGVEGAEAYFKLDVSADGSSWEELKLVKTGYKTQLKAAGPSGKKVLKVRLKNASGAEQKVYFREMRFAE